MYKNSTTFKTFRFKPVADVTPKSRGPRILYRKGLKSQGNCILAVSAADLGALLAYTPWTHWIVGGHWPVLLYLAFAAIGYVLVADAGKKPLQPVLTRRVSDKANLIFGRVQLHATTDGCPGSSRIFAGRVRTQALGGRIYELQQTDHQGAARTSGASHCNVSLVCSNKPARDVLPYSARNRPA